MRIAILGWGSLIWDHRPEFAEFDGLHDDWRDDGPVLKLEFARVSSSREGALTLVIHERRGAPCQTLWCLSHRETLEEAVDDLMRREGATQTSAIGHLTLADSRQDLDGTSAPGAIAAWMRRRDLDAVVWTALQPNYQRIRGHRFSVTEAIAYLRSLNATGRAQAIRYVHLAPPAIQTPLRAALVQEPWFQEGVRLLDAGDGCESRGR